jgi:uncharacterized protein YdcH (DUF465 family)
MWGGTCARVRHSWAILKRSAFSWVAGLFSVLGAAALIRDEALSAEWQSRLKMANWLPQLEWHWWAIAALVFLLIAVLEGSYREFRDLSAAAGRHDPRSNRLREFYAEVDEMIDRLRAMKKGEEEEAERAVDQDIQPRVNAMLAWVNLEMGKAAGAKFADRGGPARTYYVDADNTNMIAFKSINSLERVKENIGELLKDDVWYNAPSPAASARTRNARP